jgi:Ankyrin repeats (many copies)
VRTLAKQIIYGNLNDVATFIKRDDIKLNEIDEYGYTPLIQSAIVNSVPKAKLLLAAGADVNFTDLTGRTALHWAVDNNNLELARLLLEHHANPNAYTRAGQPVLAMPFLRDQNPIKQLLYRYGADLNFAQDFINAKLLGHRFELEGRVDILDNQGTFNEIEFEGFYLEFSLAIVAESLIDFRNNFGGKHLRRFFPELKYIIGALQNGVELIKYQHYLVEIKEYEQKIDLLLNLNPLLIPIAYEGHAISFIKFDDWLIRCDRGEFGRDNGTVIFYKMGEPHYLNKSLIKNLIYKRQGKQFIDEGLVKMLQLKPMGYLPLPTQISGNCSWANIEAVIPTMMFILLLQQQKMNDVVSIEDCKRNAMFFYNEWLEWDKNRALYFCINTFYHSTPARKATKAAILAAILFQKCEYLRSEDREKAKKILPVLTTSEYTYILNSYFQVFSPAKDNQQIKNLVEFLDEFGIDAKTFAADKTL